MHADPDGPSDPAFVPFEAEAVEQSIPVRFDAQATRHPDRLALAGVDRRLTYRELDRLTNRLARAIVALLGEGEEPVALLLPQGVFVVVAIFAALKAGKIYVVLDPELPDARMAELLGDSQARLIVTAGSDLERARGLAREGQHVLDGDALDAAGVPTPLSRCRSRLTGAR